MDKNAIKKYAVWARRELISRVSQRAALYGITEKDAGDASATNVNGHVLSETEKKQRQALISQIRSKGYEQVMEEVAYTWFNRFSALRFMEVNGYLPSHVRVFTDDENAFKPQILTEAINLEIAGIDMEKVYALKNSNDNDELFKYLIIVQCNALSEILPGMFQRIADYTELLFPDNLLREGSAVEQMIALIPQEDWQDQVQIIGWLYQYYNIEPKAAVDKKVKDSQKVNKEELPAKTQLFTPDWIVRYMVENSLGRLWIEGHPNNELQSRWKYYLKEGQQDSNAQTKLVELRKEYAELRPEDITVIDPCSGSGHILAYMFDVLVQIYEAQGYTTRDAARCIVEHNIYGLDIDDRAAQLAYFSVMMKGRQYDSRFFKRGVQPHVYSVIESNYVDQYALDYYCNGDAKISKAIKTIIEELRDAKEYGSLLNITVQDWKMLYDRFEAINDDISMMKEQALAIRPLVQVAEVLSKKYDVVVTNPPYLGAGDTSPKLLSYIKKNYIAGRTDLFAVFMKKCSALTKEHRYYSMITMQAWMFQSSFTEIREMLLRQQLISLLHLGAHAFEEISGEIVQTAAFSVLKYNNLGFMSTCIDLSAIDSAAEKETNYLSQNALNYECKNEQFSKLPGLQFSYWISDAVQRAFAESVPLSELGIARRGLQTGNAPKYIRYWYEVDYKELTLPGSFTSSSSVNWVLENNGGPVRKWYNSIMNAVLWKNNGAAIKNCSSSIIPSEELYFKKCLTWNKLTTKGIALKLQVPGIIPGDLSPFFIANNNQEFTYCFGLMNSRVAGYMMRVLNPTITTPTGDVAKFPVLVDMSKISMIQMLVDECVAISKEDSCQNEDSWEFCSHPLVYGNTIELACKKWNELRDNRRDRLKNAEEKLNKLFIDIYGLEQELTSDVDDESITLLCPNLRDDIKSLISYAVGCMFGRYSLDIDGLVYAGGNWDQSKYSIFIPDKDAILPICDDEYFTDDIVGRFVEFIRIVYGADTLDENLKYIADALGGKGQPKEVIRNYFMNDFYADHLKIYQKRPIYWQFDSGKKGGFKALVYMHRYQPDTIARIRTDYVHEQQSRYRTAIADLQNRIANAGTGDRVKLTKKLKTLQDQAEEIRVYEEKIHHLADQMITIDLDDGVKVNYAKFQDVLAKIK